MDEGGCGQPDGRSGQESYRGGQFCIFQEQFNVYNEPRCLRTYTIVDNWGTNSLIDREGSRQGPLDPR